MVNLHIFLFLLAIVYCDEVINFSAVPFDLSAVTLAKGSRFEVMQDRNLDYLTSLDLTRLMCLYTSAANITGTFQNPTCRAYDHPQYWGHYLGHWLSATALLCKATGNSTVCSMGATVVNMMSRCQSAWSAKGHSGYLFPYDPIAFQNLENPPGNCKPVCVPFYVMHKMMAGLLDQYTLAANKQALVIANGMAAWVKQNVESVLKRGGENLWQEVLSTEWGGMNEVLFNLYEITQNQDHLTTAYYFNHYSWTAPLSINIDDLSGNHANTHIPEVIGDARGYELTGNTTQKDISVNFLNILLGAHTFATGGSNDHEYWGDAHRLGDQLNSDTEESCTTYNVLKLGRHLYQWSADSSLADFYERALFNGLVGNQNRVEPYGAEKHTTGFIYMLPLGGGGIKKGWGASNTGFPCCWGTLSEVFSKLGDSIFFQSPDHSTLFVNLFVSATLQWPEQGAQITQVSGFPESTTSTTSLQLTLKAPVTFKMNIRVPYWATGNNVVRINNQPFSGTVTPGKYLTISRTWSNGDRVDVYYPASLRFERIDDNRPEWKNVGAVMYGGILLAGITSTDHLTGDPAHLDDWIHRTSQTDLTFSATSSCGSMSLIPLMDITSEAYTIYFHTLSTGSVVHYDPRGSVLPGNPTDFDTTGGATVVPNGRDQNIRSGDPGETTQARYTTQVQDNSHPITGLSLSYRYVSGYGPAGQHRGAIFTVSVQGECDTKKTVLYTSPELVDYPFDVCQTCYSPNVDVRVAPGSVSIPVTNPSVLLFEFQNNDRNVQILLPLNVTVYWG